MKLYKIEKPVHSLPTAEFAFGVVPKRVWQKISLQRRKLLHTGHALPAGGYRRQADTMDTGTGEKQLDNPEILSFPKESSILKRSLTSRAYSCADVTDVILTTSISTTTAEPAPVLITTKSEIVLTFPNAEYWVGKAQWENSPEPECAGKATRISGKICYRFMKPAL